MKGFNLLCLLVLVAAAVSLACSQEVSEPKTSAQSDTDIPTATAAPVTETVNPMPTAISTEVATRDSGQEGPQGTNPMPTAISTEVATPPAAPRLESGTGGGNGGVMLLGSHSAPAPSRLGAGNIGGVRMSPLPQTVAMEGSLTVSVIGTVTVAPDEAYVVVFPERDFGPSGPQPLSLEDRQEIVANLVAIGLNEEAVEFEHRRRYEPSTILVQVEVDQIASTGDAIVDAVEEVVRRSESFGVRFGLSEENCVRAISLARREAVPGTKGAADDLADALDLELGEVAGALEYPLQNVPYVVPGADLNPCTAQNDPRYGVLLPFDSEPEVEVSVGLQVSYRIR